MSLVLRPGTIASRETKVSLSLMLYCWRSTISYYLVVRSTLGTVILTYCCTTVADTHNHFVLFTWYADLNTQTKQILLLDPVLFAFTSFKLFYTLLISNADYCILQIWFNIFSFTMSVHEASSQQSCDTADCDRVESKRRRNSFFAVKFCLLLGTGAGFLITMKHEPSRMTTFLWFASGFGFIWLLYDIVASHTVGWFTELILRHLCRAAHYLLRLLFVDLWNSRSKKRWWRQHNMLSTYNYYH